MKTCLVIGPRSDIYKGIKPMMEADGWKLIETISDRSWDVCFITIGRVAPVGNWWEQGWREFNDCVNSNLLVPMMHLKAAWPYRSLSSTVIWLSGSNPQKIMNGYAPYNASKMAVIKLIEQLDHETPDCKFVALGPGYVPTKIHKATLEKGWPNERIARGDSGTPLEKIYETWKWVVDQPKEIVGGRNICVSDNKENITGDKFKLRRVE